MKFVDQITIKVRAGDGGSGSASFRREKYVPKGGPDGGDGGRGGDVYLRADAAHNHLGLFLNKRSFRAGDGEGGSGRSSSGSDGRDHYIPVPLGTLVFNNDTNELIDELLSPDDSLLVARGGQRGLGNQRFKSSVNRSPRRTTPGTHGEERSLRLELRIIADVGLIGKPNAGKSSLLNRLTNARAEVGDYAFTTIHPVLGIMREDYDEDYRCNSIADIPGLVAGASRGKGLGYDFLRHIMRTHLLLHLVDCCADDIPADIAEVEHNLHDYHPRLRDYPRILALTKSDRLEPEAIARLRDKIAERTQLPCHTCSSITGEGVETLASAINQHFKQKSAQ